MVPAMVPAIEPLSLPVESPVDPLSLPVQTGIDTITPPVQTRLYPVAFPVEAVGETVPAHLPGTLGPPVQTLIDAVAFPVQTTVNAVASPVQTVFNPVAPAVQPVFDPVAGITRLRQQGGDHYTREYHAKSNKSLSHHLESSSSLSLIHHFIRSERTRSYPLQRFRNESVDRKPGASGEYSHFDRIMEEKSRSAGGISPEGALESDALRSATHSPVCATRYNPMK